MPALTKFLLAVLMLQTGQSSAFKLKLVYNFEIEFYSMHILIKLPSNAGEHTAQNVSHKYRK